jgi:type IV secretory pathway VirB2 component (pilin)
MNSPATYLTDPPAHSPIADGVTWVQGVALGTTATAIAILAIAGIGLLMLSGRLELRRGVTVVIGCFILFGVSGVAATLTGLSGINTQSNPPAPSNSGPLSNQLRSPTPTAYDPYAGASVPAPR